jgi:hypothetical protein
VALAFQSTLTFQRKRAQARQSARILDAEGGAEYVVDGWGGRELLRTPGMILTPERAVERF